MCNPLILCYSLCPYFQKATSNLTGQKSRWTLPLVATFTRLPPNLRPQSFHLNCKLGLQPSPSPQYDGLLDLSRPVIMSNRNRYPNTPQITEYDENNLSNIEEARLQSRNVLRNRLESVIKKFSLDYSDVSDVINFATDQVEVDNGHLRRMRHDYDIGSLGVAEAGEQYSVTDEDMQDADEPSDIEPDVSKFRGITRQTLMMLIFT